LVNFYDFSSSLKMHFGIRKKTNPNLNRPNKGPTTIYPSARLLSPNSQPPPLSAVSLSSPLLSLLYPISLPCSLSHARTRRPPGHRARRPGPARPTATEPTRRRDASVPDALHRAPAPPRPKPRARDVRVPSSRRQEPRAQARPCTPSADRAPERKPLRPSVVLTA
jgi:hypothetical protein